MKIWIDADACPKVIKELLLNVSRRTNVPLTFVANKYIHMPPSPLTSFIMVEAGLDVADAKIAELCMAGDLVITADIPLAALVIKKGAFALNPRGEFYDDSNIHDILATRNLMDSLRGALMEEANGGPAPFAAKDREKFANSLDKFLAKNK